MFGAMDCLHFCAIISLVANRICITMILNLAGKEITPKLRIASCKEGFVIMPVTSDMEENIFFPKRGDLLTFP